MSFAYIISTFFNDIKQPYIDKGLQNLNFFRDDNFKNTLNYFSKFILQMEIVCCPHEGIPKIFDKIKIWQIC